jgi:hypothetical protein
MSSTSAFSELENTIIWFESAVGDLVENESGNISPAVLTTKVTGFFEQSQKQNIGDRVQIPGINLNSIYIEGYCVDPEILPLHIKSGGWYPCNFSGADGHIFILDPINPPYGRSGLGAIIEESTGTRLTAIFQSGRRPPNAN